MRYRPFWRRIIILAAVVNLVLLVAFSSILEVPAPKVAPSENLQEIAWVDLNAESDISTETVTPTPAAEKFQPFEMPPLEIQHTDFPPLPTLEVEPPKIPKIEETKPEVKPEPENKPPENKTETENKPAEVKKNSNPADSLVAIVKVYPKDLMEQIIATGAIKEKVTLNVEKVVLAVTITTEGKVRNVEIRQGGGNDERGQLINFVASTAAQSWIFEPYLDADGNPQELKTQIEFKPEDF